SSPTAPADLSDPTPNRSPTRRSAARSRAARAETAGCAVPRDFGKIGFREGLPSWLLIDNTKFINDLQALTGYGSYCYSHSFVIRSIAPWVGRARIRTCSKTRLEKTMKQNYF